VRFRVGLKCGTHTSSSAVQTDLTIRSHSMHSFFRFGDFEHTHVEFCLELEFN
jgi:hypothetical protein